MRIQKKDRNGRLRAEVLDRTRTIHILIFERSREVMINVVNVKNRDEGYKKAHDILKKLVDNKTLLALSGGTSVDYRVMLGSSDVVCGAICVVDERYGKPFHKDSNELLLRNQGVKDFADKNCIKSHKILKGKDFLETAKVYEKEIEDLFTKFKNKVGVMGIGTNLHTAGIFPYSVSAKSPNFVEAEVAEDTFPRRITLTLRALGEFTNFVILAFGKEKKDALRKVLDEGENDMQKYPAIFYRKSKIKSYLITDQTL